MRYFELSEDRDIANPIQIEHLDGSIYKNNLSEEEYAALPIVNTGYFDDDR